jgi:hypothetical protein
LASISRGDELNQIATLKPTSLLLEMSGNGACGSGNNHVDVPRSARAADKPLERFRDRSLALWRTAISPG